MRRIGPSWLNVALAAAASACASAPPVVPGPPPPSFEEKLSWILRFEDRRVLRDPVPDPPPVAPPLEPPRGRRQPAAVLPPPPPPAPDLVRLLADDEARVRRRAALAVGRVGLREGVVPLANLLRDPEPEVRQMAAFALGLLGDPGVREPLEAALDDESALVRGRAAEALGLIGDAAAAPAIAAMMSAVVDSGVLADPPGDEDDAHRDTPAAAFRLGLFALVRLQAFDAVAATLLDATGQPRIGWWPVAYALQRLEDPRALPALLTLARNPHPYTRAFAARGLGAIRDRSAVPVLLSLVSSPDRAVAIEAIRALGRIGDRAAAQPLLALMGSREADAQVRLEAVAAVGGVGGEGVVDTLLDTLGDRSPPVRAAALRSLAQLDAEGFVFVLSGLDPDRHWSVRAALAGILGTLSPEAGLPRLRSLLEDEDDRVIPAALTALAALNPPDAVDILLGRLRADDFVVRATAAAAIGRLKPTGAVEALSEAYRAGEPDVTYVARAAALGALAQYGAAAVPVLREALGDKDWAVRVRAAMLLRELDPSVDVTLEMRPAPTRHPDELYASARLVAPSVSTHVFIETDRGAIQIELAVLEAPLTVEHFVALARRGFFDGLTFHRVVPNFVVQGGDPRGDGEGGPGFTIRDELSERPYLRGTVGIALDWADTGGSQFFITHSPQPHLNARYTVIGRVIEGMDVVDQLQPWDVIRRVRVWDGETPLN